MSYRFLYRKAVGARRMARQLKANIAGVAAVEFGLIAPLLLIMLIGTVEISRAISIDRRLGLATAMVGDLVAREEDMTAADLNAIYDIVEHVMEPYDVNDLKLAVIPVQASSTNKTNTRVYASSANRPAFNGKSNPSTCATYALTTGLVDEGDSVIVVESSYDYRPLFGNDYISATTWTDKSVLSPRNSCVDFDDNNCVWQCGG